MPIGIEGALDWGHDYQGATFYEDINGIAEINCHALDAPALVSGGFLADPLSVPALQRDLRGSLHLEDDTHPGSSRPLHYPRKNIDVFAQLPPEILHYIVTELLSKDVVSVRMASPVFSCLHLPEAFWASRFEAPNEYQYIYEGSKNPPNSWKTLYFLVRTWVTSVSGLRNRKRVWELSSRLQLLLRQLSGMLCQGTPLRTFVDFNELNDNQNWLTASAGSITPRRFFKSGCRPIHSRVIQSLTQPFKYQSIGVSFTNLGDEIFVSGMRFISPDSSSYCIGYIQPSQEVTICVPQSQNLKGWHLAMDISGIRAVSLVFSDGHTSSWAGEPGGLPRWYLAVDEDLAAVKAEFDVSLTMPLSVYGSYSLAIIRGSRWFL